MATVVSMGFFTLICILLYQGLSEVNFADIKSAIGEVGPEVLGFGLLLVLLNYLILGSFDYLGLRYLGEKKISTPRVYWSALTCYTFTLNLGALVGGLGLRYRIYSKWGVGIGVITKLILFSTLSNWLGHVLLLAISVGLYPDQVFQLTGLSKLISYIISFLGLSAVVLYIFLCINRTQIKFKSEHFIFPPLRLALLQLGLSIAQWSLLAIIIVLLFKHLGHKVNFTQVIFTYLITGIAGVLTHIPAGLGVHEAIFLKMKLSSPSAHIIVVLLYFRLIYYLIPFMVAAPGYLFLEFYQKKIRQRRS